MERQGEGSNYRSDYTNDQLYKLVRKAAFKLSPTRPVKLSTRRFDAGREALDEPDAPSAKWIAKRLGHPWPELVKVVCNSERDTTMTDSAARRAPAEPWLDQRHLHFALRYAAKERSEETFSAFDYDATRTELLKAEQHDPNGDRRLSIILPTSGQIIQIVRRIEKAETEATATEAAPSDASTSAAEKKGKEQKSKKTSRKTRELLPELDESAASVEELDETTSLGLWNKALVLAGLQPYVQSKKTGVPYVEALHYYIEATGLLPTSRKEMERFARAVPFSVERGGPTSDYVTEVAAYRAKLGLPMADEIGKRGQRPDFDLSKVPTDLPKPKRQHGEWANDEPGIIDALCEYLDTVKARNVRQPNRADYVNEQAGRHEWPAAATLGRVGPCSFTAWIERAQVVWKKRQKKAA